MERWEAVCIILNTGGCSKVCIFVVADVSLADSAGRIAGSTCFDTFYYFILIYRKVAEYSLGSYVV